MQDRVYWTVLRYDQNQGDTIVEAVLLDEQAAWDHARKVAEHIAVNTGRVIREPEYEHETILVYDEAYSFEPTDDDRYQSLWIQRVVPS